MTVYERFETKGEKFTIYYDNNAVNPRKDWDGWLTEFVASPEVNRAYGIADRTFDDDGYEIDLINTMFAPVLADQEAQDIRDEYDDIDEDDFEDEDGFLDENALIAAQAVITKKLRGLAESRCYVKDIHLYDHSGVTISTSPFTCPWDAWQAGVVILTKESMKEAGHDPEDTKKAEEIIDGEVKVFDTYLRGEVYGFIREKRVKTTREDGEPGPDDWDEVGACWGFYGDDGLKQIKEENKDFFEALAKEEADE